MRDIASTVAVIGSIAVIVALMFLAPKGFQLGEPNPIVSADTATIETAAE